MLAAAKKSTNVSTKMSTKEQYKKGSKTTFYITEAENGKITSIPVEGEPVIFDCCPDFLFFVFKSPENNFWYVNEALTGTTIDIYGETSKKKALEKAQEILNEKTEQEIAEAIDVNMGIGYISPLRDEDIEKIRKTILPRKPKLLL